WPTSVPATPMLKIDSAGTAVSIADRRLCWRHASECAAEKCCSNSLVTRYCTTALPGTGPSELFEQGASTSVVYTVWLLVIGSAAPSKKCCRIETSGQALYSAPAPPRTSVLLPSLAPAIACVPTALYLATSSAAFGTSRSSVASPASAFWSMGAP